jgi:hypothetical protein
MYSHEFVETWMPVLRSVQTPESVCIHVDIYGGSSSRHNSFMDEEAMAQDLAMTNDYSLFLCQTRKIFQDQPSDDLFISSDIQTLRNARSIEGDDNLITEVRITNKVGGSI